MPNRKLVAVAGALALAVGLSACAESQRTPTTSAPQGTTGATAAPTDSGNANADATFIFGAAGAPKLFDPFYASDGETFRVTRQIYEQLLDFLPGEAKTGPGLAESYEGSEDGLTWTFKIREGVTFHDGTDEATRT